VPTFTHLTPRDYRTVPWRNGGGSTTEIAIEPGGPGGFLWRLSIAEVAASGPFSDFAGYERTLLLLDGAGFVLRFAEAPPRRVGRRLEPFTFDGGWHAQCDLVDGPARDLNLMVARGAVEGRLRVLALARGERIVAPAGETAVVHLLEGALESGGFRLQAGDTLRADGCRGEPVVLAAAEGSVAIHVALSPAPA